MFFRVIILFNNGKKLVMCDKYFFFNECQIWKRYLFVWVNNNNDVLKCRIYPVIIKCNQLNEKKKNFFCNKII